MRAPSSHVRGKDGLLHELRETCGHAQRPMPPMRRGCPAIKAAQAESRPPQRGDGAVDRREREEVPHNHGEGVPNGGGQKNE